MTTDLFSILSDRKARVRLAMTGELSLQGKALPVRHQREDLSCMPDRDFDDHPVSDQTTSKRVPGFFE